MPDLNKTKVTWWWAEIGESKPEPVAVLCENGVEVAYTSGCADPFIIHEKNIFLMQLMLVPESTADKKARKEAEERLRNSKKQHGWRRLGELHA